jgi:hypothetical protein
MSLAGKWWNSMVNRNITLTRSLPVIVLLLSDIYHFVIFESMPIWKLFQKQARSSKSEKVVSLLHYYDINKIFTRHLNGSKLISLFYSITKVVTSNPVHGEVYSIQHYVIKFVSDCDRLVVDPGPPVSSNKKTDRHDTS